MCMVDCAEEGGKRGGTCGKSVGSLLYDRWVVVSRRALAFGGEPDLFGDF